jgi:hypothetical protein
LTPKSRGLEGRGIADGTVDDRSRPAVAAPELGEPIAEQGGAQAAAAVDDQHPAVAGLAEHASDQGVRCGLTLQLPRLDALAEPFASQSLVVRRAGKPNKAPLVKPLFRCHGGSTPPSGLAAASLG